MMGEKSDVNEFLPRGIYAKNRTQVPEAHHGCPEWGWHNKDSFRPFESITGNRI